MARRWLVWIAAVAATTLWSSAALGIDGEGSVELGFHAQSQEDGPGIFVFSPHPRGHASLTDEVFVEASLPAIAIFYIGDDEEDSNLIDGLESQSDDDFELGNPYLGAGVAISSSVQTLKLRTGVTLPVARPDGALALSFGEGMRSGWEPWLWAPRRLSPVFGADFQHRLDSALAVDAGASIAPMIWMGDGSRDTEIAGQAHVDITGQPGDGEFETGLRLSGVYGPSLATPDESSDLQMGLQPFARLHVNDQIYSARLSIPLNDPYGFGFSSDGVWALHLGAGTRF